MNHRYNKKVREFMTQHTTAAFPFHRHTLLAKKKKNLRWVFFPFHFSTFIAIKMSTHTTQQARHGAQWSEMEELENEKLLLPGSKVVVVAAVASSPYINRAFNVMIEISKMAMLLFDGKLLIRLSMYASAYDRKWTSARREKKKEMSLV